MRKFSLLLFSVFGIGLLSLILSVMGCEVRSDKIAYLNLKAVVLYDDSSRQVLNNFDSCNYSAGFVSVNLLGQLISVGVLAPFENSAFAFTKTPPTYASVEKILDFKVVSLNNYNANISAGEEVSSRCIWGLESSDSILSKEEVIEKLNKKSYLYHTWVGNTQRCKFKLDEAPASASIQQFAIEVTLEKNTKFRDTTVAFVLRP